MNLAHAFSDVLKFLFESGNLMYELCIRVSEAEEVHFYSEGEEGVQGLNQIASDCLLCFCNDYISSLFYIS
jgi:hypothetical protein